MITTYYKNMIPQNRELAVGLSKPKQFNRLLDWLSHESCTVHTNTANVVNVMFRESGDRIDPELNERLIEQVDHLLQNGCIIAKGSCARMVKHIIQKKP